MPPAAVAPGSRMAGRGGRAGHRPRSWPPAAAGPAARRASRRGPERRERGHGALRHLRRENLRGQHVRRHLREQRAARAPGPLAVSPMPPRGCSGRQTGRKRVRRASNRISLWDCSLSVSAIAKRARSSTRDGTAAGQAVAAPRPRSPRARAGPAPHRPERGPRRPARAGAAQPEHPAHQGRDDGHQRDPGDQGGRGRAVARSPGAPSGRVVRRPAPPPPARRTMTRFTGP